MTYTLYNLVVVSWQEEKKSWRRKQTTQGKKLR